MDISNKEFNVLDTVTLSEFVHVQQLYKKIISLHRDCYHDNDRIVFIQDSLSDNILILLQEILEFVGIPYFFVYIISNRHIMVNEKIKTFIDHTITPCETPDISLSASHCIYPWINLEINTNGTLKPCCISRNNIHNEDNRKLNIHTDSIADAYFSSHMVNLRKSFLNGDYPIDCASCWKTEAAGGLSPRQQAKYKFKDIYYNIDYHDEYSDNLKIFDIKLGNACNLSCRICSPSSSSTIANLEYKAGRLPKDSYHEFKKLKSLFDTDIFWDKIFDRVDTLSYLDIYGGEPLLSNLHFKFLEKQIVRGVAQNIKLDYNSNGTIFSEKFVQIWEQFQQVKISFSIDDINQRFEYQRNGALWHNVNKNITKYNQIMLTNFVTDAFPTVNIQNVYYLPELIEWVYSKNFSVPPSLNILRYPEKHAITNIPDTIKLKIIEKLEKFQHYDGINSIINTLANSTPNYEYFEDFLQYTKLLDAERGQKFASTFPEFSKLIMDNT